MANNATTQAEAAEIFQRLHHNGQVLLLPNIWDPLGALLLADIGYPAVATSSAAISWSQGYADGEKMPFETLLRILKRIADCSSVPVTADVERGYATNDTELAENIRKLLDTGIVGINYEDNLPGQPALCPIEEQCRKIERIRNTAQQFGVRLFINARVDVYLKAAGRSADEQLSESLKRGKAYREAGADGLYPILLKDTHHMETLSRDLGMPLNVTLLPGMNDFNKLKALGVTRISMASGYIKSAIDTLKRKAELLFLQHDLEAATVGMVSGDYINSLVSE